VSPEPDFAAGALSANFATSASNSARLCTLRPVPTAFSNIHLASVNLSIEMGFASFFREPFYYDTSGVPTWPDATVGPIPVDSRCYTTSAMFSGTSPWGRFFYLGGPGNEASNSCR